MSGESYQIRRVHSGHLDRLRQEIMQIRRQNDSVARSRSIFLSDLMLVRLEQGLTQTQLASRSGLTQSAVARIESGKTSPTLDSLIKLAQALNRQLMLE